MTAVKRLPLWKKGTLLIKKQFKPALQTAAKKKFVFIHINKTGGTSITRVVGQPYRRHLTAKEVIDDIGMEKWRKAYKFTVVRNPWDKYFSMYKWRKKTNIRGIADEDISFSDWVKRTLEEKDPDYYDYFLQRMFQPQVDWLKDYSGHIDMDKIIRFENLQHDFKKVADTIGAPAELPHYHKTQQVSYREFYDAEAREIVAEWFKEDIKRFDYQF